MAADDETLVGEGRSVRVRTVAWLLLLLVVAVVSGAVGVPGVRAQAVPVAVFEGQGLGHGVGLPLDGAQHLATGGASADEILERFYPGTRLRNGGGLVRVLLATRDDVAAGIELALPDGGVVRDGRTTPVAPSFPLLVPSGGTVRVTHHDDVYRAEVVDERSVTGTVELPPDGEGGDGGDAADAAPAPEPGGDGELPPPPGLAASPHTLWIAPREGGVVDVAPERSADTLGHRGPMEVVVEAGRLHVVEELDVEDYLQGVDLEIHESLELHPAARQATAVAVRTYALRAAAGETKVGRFHLHADERSHVYVGRTAGARAGSLAGAAAETRGRVVEADGVLAATTTSVSAGGTTASGGEVYGERAADLAYLAPVTYETDREFRWRVDLDLSEVGRRLGYRGTATDLEVTRSTASGRPAALRVEGSSGVLDVGSSRFHHALGLPSTSFEVRVETRSEPVATREDSPPFQELPEEPLGDSVPTASDGEGDGGDDFPTLLAVVAAATLGLSLITLGVANLQRRLHRRRERRRRERRRRERRREGRREGR